MAHKKFDIVAAANGEPVIAVNITNDLQHEVIILTTELHNNAYPVTAIVTGLFEKTDFQWILSTTDTGISSHDQFQLFMK